MNLLKRFPSYDLLLKNAGESFKRFPLTLISAAFATLMAVTLIQQENHAGHHLLEKLIMVGVLGIPFFISLAIFAENRVWPRARNILLQILGLVLIVLYYLSLPANPFEIQSVYARYILLVISAHLLVSFLPFLEKDQVGGFWQYNKSLFIRILISALYSAVMFIGLLIALMAAEELFGLNIPEKRYFQLWVIIAGIFNTWVFLAGVPKNLPALRDYGTYPMGLKIFTQYILLPLVGLYLVILYAYEFKIIITWNWPKGWVSQLVLWFSIVGILSLLLLWPLRELSENRWIKNFTKWFFRALIPLVVMLFLAILERVGVYGITVNRFLVLAMATGLAILVLYFVFWRKKDIRFIPLIVCLIAMLSAYGPWSAFAISRRSQQSRLENLLIKNGVWVDGEIKQAGDISFEQRAEMTSVISYLVGWHGLASISPWLPDSTLSALESKAEEKYGLSDTIALSFGFAPAYRRGSPENPIGEPFSYDHPDSEAVDISDYDHLLFYSTGRIKSGDTTGIFHIEDGVISVQLLKNPPALKFDIKSDSLYEGSAFEFSLREPIEAAMKSIRHGKIDGEGFTKSGVIGNYDSNIIIDHLWGSYLPDSIEVRSLSAFILLRKM